MEKNNSRDLDLLEHQATLILYDHENDELTRIMLHEHCNALTLKSAAAKMHVSIRNKLNTDDTFYINVIDETELKSGYFKCSSINTDKKIIMADGQTQHYKKIYNTTKIKNEGLILKSFKVAGQENVLKSFNDDIENAIIGNQQSIIDILLCKCETSE
jgi:hypothetical protein